MSVANGVAIDDRAEAAGRRLQVIRDRVAQVGRGFAAGLYLYGRPGISKTHTVIETLLETVGEGRFTHDKGHLTPVGLFELLESHADKIVVLDDVSSLFKSSIAMNILLAALGGMSDGVRQVDYRRAGGTISFEFTGRLIAISNL